MDAELLFASRLVQRESLVVLGGWARFEALSVPWKCRKGFARRLGRVAALRACEIGNVRVMALWRQPRHGVRQRWRRAVYRARLLVPQPLLPFVLLAAGPGFLVVSGNARDPLNWPYCFER